MKVRSKATAAENITEPSKINSMKLIHLVRSCEALYNSDADGYSDKNHKEIIWEHIHKALFPKYDTLADAVKDEIRVNVRRRWKTLRNSIAREVKKNATVENYSRKKESPIMAELEFLIPHIKSAHCAKLADELGLRESYACMNETDEPDEEHDEDYNDLIDLTEEFDIKPIIKSDISYHLNDNTTDGIDSLPPHDALYPAVQMSTGDTRPNDVPMVQFGSEYCTVGQYKEGEFMNSTVLGPGQNETTEESGSDDAPSGKPSSPVTTECRKRPRTETNESAELQAKILQLLTNLERRERLETRADLESHDEDRMFLLSLVSDLKSVPAAKKMLVKAEIATAIARALP